MVAWILRVWCAARCFTRKRTSNGWTSSRLNVLERKGRERSESAGHFEGRHKALPGWDHRSPGRGVAHHREGRIHRDHGAVWEWQVHFAQPDRGGRPADVR